MRFRVLGSVGVWDGRSWSPVAATKQRELLAIMLLHPGRTLDRAWLIDTLWRGRPPPSAGPLLAHYVWRLRTLLPGGTGLLRTVPSGYLLAVGGEDIDRQRFNRLVAEGRAALGGVPDRAIGAFSAALDLWRGPALADARALPVLAGIAYQLDRSHLEVRELLAESLLRAGRHAEAVTMLEELTLAEPLREPLWRMLMLALHRSGRRAEALTAFHRLRRVSREQLGLEPGRDVRELHHRILADDPALRPAARATTHPQPG